MGVKIKCENIRIFNIIVVFSHSEKRVAPSLSLKTYLVLFVFCLAQSIEPMTYNMDRTAS